MEYCAERVEELLKQERTHDNVDELVRRNTGLIFSQLYKLHVTNEPDAISAAYEALYKAIMTYDGKSKFSTYATVCIYNAVGSVIRNMNTQIRINTSSYDIELDDTGSTVLQNLESFDTADKNALSNAGVSLVMHCVDLCLKELKNPLHKNIIESWATSNFEKQHTKIASELGCSQTYVTQIIKKFRHQLKKKMGEF